MRNPVASWLCLAMSGEKPPYYLDCPTVAVNFSELIMCLRSSHLPGTYTRCRSARRCPLLPVEMAVAGVHAAVAAVRLTAVLLAAARAASGHAADGSAARAQVVRLAAAGVGGAKHKYARGMVKSAH